MQISAVPLVYDGGRAGVQRLNAGPGRVALLIQEIQAVAVTGGADPNDLFGVYAGRSDYLLNGLTRALPQDIHAAFGPTWVRILRFGLAAGDLDLTTFQVKERRFGNRVAVVNAKKILGHQSHPLPGMIDRTDKCSNLRTAY